MPSELMTDEMQVKVYYDRTADTLTVWFGNPADEYVCEEVGEEVVLMKDRNQHVIGFEKSNLFDVQGIDQFTGKVQVAIETVG